MLFHVATVKSRSVSESSSGQLLEAAMFAERMTGGTESTAEVGAAKTRGRDRAKRHACRSRSAPRMLRSIPMQALHSVVCISMKQPSDDVMNDG